MQVALYLLAISAVYSAYAVPILEDETEYQYPRFIDFPDGEGNMHQVDLEAEPNMEVLEEITRNPERNLYLLFTRRNPHTAQTLIINDVESITNSNFNPNVPTVVISHGWLSNQDTDINPTIRDAYLAKYEANIIVLDWRRLALMDYITAVRGVPAIGRALGQFLAFLNSVNGAPFEKMHLIGFSLGAHVVGNAGRELGGKISRITGLDPAGPLWGSNSNRLSIDDGRYVEAIHTDGGYTIGGLGIGKRIANVDFFPNGGISQPGCLTNICNHNRAWRLFASTVTYNHLYGNKCESSLQNTLNRCRGDLFPLGNDDLNKYGDGKYRVNTARRYPY